MNKQTNEGSLSSTGHRPFRGHCPKSKKNKDWRKNGWIERQMDGRTEGRTRIVERLTSGRSCVKNSWCEEKGKPIWRYAKAQLVTDIFEALLFWKHDLKKVETLSPRVCLSDWLSPCNLLHRKTLIYSWIKSHGHHLHWTNVKSWCKLVIQEKIRCQSWTFLHNRDKYVFYCIDVSMHIQESMSMSSVDCLVEWFWAF